MNKFIIIDHSLQDLQGHHYECSVSVAEAAKRQGFQAIIIANKNFEKSLYPHDIEIISQFEVDWFNNSTKKQRGIFQRIIQLRDFFANFNLSHTYQEYIEKIKYQIFKLQLTQPKTRIFLEKVEGSLFRLYQWVKEDLQLIKSVPFSHSIGGLIKIVWGLIRYIFQTITKIILKGLNKITPLDTQTFKQSFTEVILSLNLTENDHVFIHTIGIEQLQDILTFLRQQNREQTPQYHIMLRRDIDDPLVSQVEGIDIKCCLNSFYQEGFYPTKIKFYTDTKELVDRYNSLSRIIFQQIPVPFRQEKLETEEVKSDNNHQPLHLVYLGDARREKGYLHLPQIVEDLWKDYLATKKLTITIQSNFNINSGETGILTARLQLQNYPQDVVNVIKNPLTTEEYYQLLMSADLLVIPYDRNSYRYRTSGVLTESLAAGKPVIVPSNTWLANQIDDSRGGIYHHIDDISKTIIRVINNIQECQENAKNFSISWRILHSPDSLIDCLLSSIDTSNYLSNNSEIKIKVSDSQDKISANLLMIVNGDKLLKLDTNAQIILSHLEYLSQKVDNISLIIYSEIKDDDVENKNNFSETIKSLVSNYSINNIYCLYEKVSVKFIPSLDESKYINHIYHNRQSFTRDLININNLVIPESLSQSLQRQEFKAIFFDCLASQMLVNQLSLNHISSVCQVLNLPSSESAMVNHEEIDSKELEIEFNLFNQVSTILVNREYIGEKLFQNHPHLKIYTLPQYQELSQHHKTISNSKLNSFIWGNNQKEYHSAIAQSLSLDVINSENESIGKKIAILYPWQDILERKSGASQRVGLLLDYLKNNNHHLWLFTTGEEKELIVDDIRYTFHEQKSHDLDLVKKIYTDIYHNLINSKLTEEIIIKDDLIKDWRLSMYYQFNYDNQFKQWIERITDWADVVILEYPFWATAVSDICRKKQIKLIITAHDIICQQISPKNFLHQILLREEIANLKKGNEIICVSEKDQEFLAKWNINSTIVPNPVKLNNNALTISSEEINEQIKNYSWLEENYCLFVGSGHFPNVEAVKQIRKIAEIYHQEKINTPCNFVVIGNCCEEENNGNFIALGKVEIDLLTMAYKQAKIILAPMLHGTGSSLKIMEAMSYGKIIIGTKIAFRGFNIHHQEEAIIEDNLTNYPNIIAQVLTHPQKFQNIEKNSLNLAQKYDYQKVYQTYENIIISKD